MHDRPLRIAAVGFWHVHGDDYARAAREHPGTELVGVWDDDAERLAEAADRWGVELVADLAGLLARDDIDGITVTTATSDHDRVIAAALEAGKPVFTEKVLSPTVEGAQRLVALAAARGLALTVSLPRLFHGPFLTLRRLEAEGAFGQLVHVRARLAPRPVPRPGDRGRRRVLRPRVPPGLPRAASARRPAALGASRAGPHHRPGAR